ncbi:MAG: (2Fe-2S)-binding protein [Myxococcales bacterium FL481]|nr:MAG: (2Fe-2S)-binding protein [Myxococcales bacterium FL481]
MPASASALIRIRLDGQDVEVPAEASVAVAVLQHTSKFRRSRGGAARGPLCGMGICFECRVTIDGRPHQRSCQIECRPGMEVRTDAP